ncbi:MAG: amino acid adenylation domain-containing protein, partial [Candidatus Aminicenantes bacterium]|nr:amino acid adenylation domain-containing protein [Candidatus Aminicenantes bacterium]
SSKENIEPTPSDFTYKGLSIEIIDRIMESYPDVEDIYTLTPMQEGMLFHALVDDSSFSYFEQTSYRLQGELDIDLVEKSLNELVNRHHVLRTAFIHKDIETPVQVVLKNRRVGFYYEDISGREKKENFVREFKAKDKERSFDLSKDVLIRVAILRLDESEYEFIWSFYHILMDGWCVGILNSEFFEIYTGYVENREYRLPEIKPYRTYIQWLEKQDKEASAAYWANYLDSFEEQTGIPGAAPINKKENQSEYKNKKASFPLTKEKTDRLNKLAAGRSVTLNILTRTLWGILLGRYNGKRDVVFGSVVSGRPFELDGVEAMVGLFINTIPVRIRFEEKMKFHELLQRVQEEALASESYHYYPLAKIQSSSALKQNLIDHLFIFENYPVAEQIAGYGGKGNKSSVSLLEITGVDVFEQTNYDFNILLSESDRFSITFQYNENVYAGDYAERLAGHFLVAIDQVIENEELEIDDITFLSPEEKNRLLYEFNDTAAEYPADKTIHELFEEQVARVPARIAAVYLSEQITYRELDEQSGRLAYRLTEKGVAADMILGLMIQRSIKMITGILGILKAGGAYLPIDPYYPEERKQFILADSDARMLITNCGLFRKSGVRIAKLEKNSKDRNLKDRNKIPESPDLNFGNSSFEFDSDFGCRSSDSNHLYLSSTTMEGGTGFRSSVSGLLAYIIYTSGSTGKPKGVSVKHRSVVNILSSLQRAYPLLETDTYLLKTSYVFDVSVAEIFGWFLGGGRLAILEQGMEKDPQRILDTTAAEYVTHINFVPAMFSAFVEILNPQNINQLSNLRYIFLAGEALLPELVKRFRALDTRITLENIYGPTEGTIFASRYSLSDWNGEGSVPIGKPLQNIRLYILDKDNNLQPIGIPGELHISGDGLAAGYLNNPELNVEKFCRDFRNYGADKNHYKQKFLRGPGAVFSKSAPGRRRLYKTGDLARWLSDGNIEFLGRIDHQVKIRGFRVELGEIESRLRTHPGIKETVVIAREDKGRQYLCAYITVNAAKQGKENVLAVPELKEYLEGKLPVYMIPACFVKIDRIPLNTNGKIDRKKLPQPLESDFHSGGTYKAPDSDIQKVVAEIWKEILSREKVGIQDNFFDLGGNSLDFAKVGNKLKEKLNREVPVVALYTYPTIAALERYLTGDREEEIMQENQPDRLEVIDEGKDLMFQTLNKLDKEN